MKDKELIFKPTDVVEAIRKIGMAGFCLKFTRYCKNPEEFAYLFSSAVNCADSITNDKLREAAMNLFYEYIMAEEKEDLTVVMYYLMKEKPKCARQIAGLLRDRFCAEWCGVQALGAVLESKKNSDGEFIINRDTFEQLSKAQYYHLAVQKEDVKKILETWDEYLDCLREYLNSSPKRYVVEATYPKKEDLFQKI